MERVKPLVELIQRHGWTVFWDTNLEPGGAWRAHLMQELQMCIACVVVWSANSVRSDWVVEEIELSKARKNLVPVMIDMIDIPLGFRALQAANLINWKPEDRSHDQIDLVVARLRLLIERTEPAPSISTTLNRAGHSFNLRALQVASDHASPRELLVRYDYSRQPGEDPSKNIGVDADGAVWIDFAADIGGDKEAGSTLFNLMALDALPIEAVGNLQCGSILLTTDGLAPGSIHPFDYERAMRLKLEAQPDYGAEPRKLFAIPGRYADPFGKHFGGYLRRVVRDFLLIPYTANALAAFDALFCGARQAVGTRLGRWECPQHRNYWALRLPHDWLVLGVDTPAGGHIDEAQLNYFERVADRTNQGDTIIICFPEPPWMLPPAAEIATRSYSRLMEIVQKNGAIVAALLSGGVHFYSRYQSKPDQVQYITSGGTTGALHPTHWLAPKIEVRTRKLEGKRQAKKSADKVSLTLESTWPTARRSRLMSLKRLALPLLNYLFAVRLGVFYWVVVWMFSTTVIGAMTVGQTIVGDVNFHWYPDLFWIIPLAAMTNLTLGASLILFWLTLYHYVDPQLSISKRRILATLHWLAHISAMVVLFYAMSYGTIWLVDVIWPNVKEFLEAHEIDASASMRELIRSVLIFPLVLIFVGALLPGLVWGTYLFISGFLLRAHRTEAFENLGIKGYKSFLRVRLAADAATIYPIGVKSLPNTKELRSLASGSSLDPAAVLRRLRPKLIEPPIVVSKR